MDIVKMLCEEFSAREWQVENTIKLVDDGNTIPFIARYRKEMTGELNDQVLREMHERLVYLRALDARQQEVHRLISEQDKMTDALNKAVFACKTMQALEDIYRPYRPKRRTRGTMAREKGLEPLAQILLKQQLFSGNIADVASKYLDAEKGVSNVEEALAGAMDIIAEDLSDDADVRKNIRQMVTAQGLLISKGIKDEDSVYRMYYEFKEPVSRVASHRVLAMDRGEKEGFLSVSVDAPHEKMVEWMKRHVAAAKRSVTTEYVEKAAEDAYQRLIFPSIEREIRNALSETAGEQAIKVFGSNLKGLLMQPPIKGMVVLGLDPAYRTGCKLAVVDDTGKVLSTAVIYPTPPQNKVEEARKVVKELIDKYKVDVISIGNGTASREAEAFAAATIAEVNRKVGYVVVNEAGASVYSASKLGAEEFPDFDVALRSAASIARRLQDPLAELVKIDPKSIGVGQYQHDMNQKKLDSALGAVVEDCVNSVGVDLNTASPSLLSYISGINSTVAKNIVDYREINGKFKSRNELLKVKKLGDKAYQQCAGFLRIPDGKNILDNTSVHPESYEAASQLLSTLGFELADVKKRNLTGLPEQASADKLKALSEKLSVGLPTLRDIVNELLKPGRDPRDELPKPVLSTEVLELKDLRPDMVLTGTVRNVADFGAFVDIGVHQDGLVHVSELADRFVKNPMEVVKVGDIVKVRVLEVDVQRKRISLSIRKA